MEALGIPIVFTARDIIGFGLSAVCLLIWLCLGVVLLVLNLVKAWMKLRNRTD